MKLLTKTTLYIATLSLFLFFIMGVIFFQVLKNLSLSDLNREMEDLKEIVEEAFYTDPGFTSRSIPGIDSISLRKISGVSASEQVFVDTLMFDSNSMEYRTFRYLRFSLTQGSDLYQVKLFKSTTPADQLVERVTLLMTLMVILFLAGIFILNRFVFANLWKDFFDALEKLKEFDTVKEPIELGEPDIEEFIELKSVLERLTRRLASDYKELKEYTDHTTHELQTPLAVIKSKTELLLQSERLGPEEMQLIQAINTNTNHLSRLNTALALITRIENQQFTGREQINLVDLFEEQLEMLQELIDLHQITVEKEFGSRSFELTMDRGLADILVANLIRNAIVHNVEKGIIRVEQASGSMVIANSGPPLPFSEKELFRRFIKDSRKSANFGLGLSLVKKICDAYNFQIDYTYENELHQFRIQFPV